MTSLKPSPTDAECRFRDAAEYIRKRQPNARGFSAQNLWRMRQFHDAYRDQPRLSALLRELVWARNLMILGTCKQEQEREFYLRLAGVRKWSCRELGRSIDSDLFERVVLSPTKVSALLTHLPSTHHMLILGRSKRAAQREFSVRFAAQEKWSIRGLERQLGGSRFVRVVRKPPRASAVLKETDLRAQTIFRDTCASLNSSICARDVSQRKHLGKLGYPRRTPPPGLTTSRPAFLAEHQPGALD